MPLCLNAGITYFDFWELTLKEITIILQNYKEKEERRAKEITTIMYNGSVMVAQFVNLGLNGKQIPSYSELFPSTAEIEKDEEKQKELEYKKAMLLKEQFMFWAKEHNKQRHKKLGGDGL